MINRSTILTFLLLGAVCLVAAAPSGADVDKLGKELTAMGAIQAGNESGTIPAWEGGITSPPPGWKSGDHYIDPFAAEKPMYKIDGSNYKKYATMLSPNSSLTIPNNFASSLATNTFPSSPYLSINILMQLL